MSDYEAKVSLAIIPNKVCYKILIKQYIAYQINIICVLFGLIIDLG